jgi:AraC family transcriptional regulator of adaptative response/methylated-DNA-[protein]-cysteine methyltransferase
MTEHAHFQLVEQTIRYIVAHVKKQPTLEELSVAMNSSPFHLQRVFTEWAGISPKKFLQYLTTESLTKELETSHNLISVADSVGLTAQSRVYDHFVSIEAVTPGEFRSRGKGLVIEYGIHPGPFGDILIATTARGICRAAFVAETPEKEVAELKRRWESATFRENIASTGALADKLFQTDGRIDTVALHVEGTNFQVRVWEALLKIPFGRVAGYADVASAIGSAGATRAVGTAIAQNPVAYLIPCHRVIRSEGVIGNYHWNPGRKGALIGWERAMAERK